jgi:hypothetical protein
MDERTVEPAFAEPVTGSRMTRREAIRDVAALMGGLALVGADRLEALAFESSALDRVVAQGVGSFTAADVVLLDEIAETILPETATPGAKAAKTGAFMALMVTDAYTDRDQRAFRSGMQQLDEACRAMHAVPFMKATPAQRLTLLEVLDREQKTATEERTPPARTRAPGAPAAEDAPPHYFRMMKELALLGYFTSEIGSTKAMRYVESPGRFDPDVPCGPDETSWVPHA